MAESILSKDAKRQIDEMASGKFRDTNRIPEIGERIDSMTGVPLRTFMDRAQKGNFGQGLIDAAGSIGTDPRNAPTTEQLTEQALPDANPYLKAGMKTALDFADPLMMIPGGGAGKIGATVRKSRYVGKSPGGLGKSIVEDVKPFTPKYKKGPISMSSEEMADMAYKRQEQLISTQSRLDSLFERASKEAAQQGIDLQKHPKFSEIQALQNLKMKLTKGGG